VYHRRETLLLSVAGSVRVVFKKKKKFRRIAGEARRRRRVVLETVFFSTYLRAKGTH